MTDPNVVPIRELRFKPANSNDRARAGMEHTFKEVPKCSFAKDDGISPYIGADSTIGIYPDSPAALAPSEGEVPDVAQDLGAPAASFGHKLLRAGFGLSVFLHAAVALGIGYATIKMPDDSALLEGETIVAVEIFSETDSDVTTRVKQDEQEGEEEAVEKPVEQPEEEPKQEVVEPVREPVKPAEQAKLPEPVEKPVEPPVKVDQPVVGADVPEVLSTTQPSTFQVEAAAKQILDDVKVEPLPVALPPILVTPIKETDEPEKKLAQPLPHPISRPRVVKKVAEVKPTEKPVAKKEEPKPVEKKPEPKKEEPKREAAKKPAPKTDKKEVKKKTVARDGNADVNLDKGSSTAKRKKGNSQDASQGGSKRKTKGNAAFTSWKGKVEKRLERAKKRVRNKGKGDVTLAFTINADGSVSNLRVKKSSGKPAVDQAALDTVRKASPFPPIPPETGYDVYKPTMPVTFK